MKKLIFILTFIFISVLGISQSSFLVNDLLPIDSLFENKDENLIVSKVMEFGGLKREELKTKVKNWGSTKFVNLKEVLISETDDQMVFNYIDNSFFYNNIYLFFYLKVGTIITTKKDDLTKARKLLELKHNFFNLNKLS